VTIDDVPFFTVALSGRGYDHAALREMAEERRRASRPCQMSVRRRPSADHRARSGSSSRPNARLGVDPRSVVARLAEANAGRGPGPTRARTRSSGSAPGRSSRLQRTSPVVVDVRRALVRWPTSPTWSTDLESGVYVHVPRSSRRRESARVAGDLEATGADASRVAKRWRRSSQAREVGSCPSTCKPM
jgi:hypothetical protein